MYLWRRFTRLRSLNLASNNLTTLPLSLCTLRTLVELNVASNQLEELPPDIQHVTKSVRAAARPAIPAVGAIFSMFEPNRVFDYKCNPVADSFEFCTITHMYVQFMYTYRVHVHVRT